MSHFSRRCLWNSLPGADDPGQPSGSMRLPAMPPRLGTAPMLSCFTLATKVLLSPLVALLLTETRSAAHYSSTIYISIFHL